MRPSGADPNWWKTYRRSVPMYTRDEDAAFVAAGYISVRKKTPLELAYYQWELHLSSENWLDRSGVRVLYDDPSWPIRHYGARACQLEVYGVLPEYRQGEV